jgi:hypothetical protein
MKITGNHHKTVWVEITPDEATRFQAALLLYSISAVEHIRPIASLARVGSDRNSLS